VKVVDEKGNSSLYPSFHSRIITTTVEYLSSGIGVSLEVNNVVTLLNRMGLSVSRVEGNTLDVFIGPTRSDIMHACDLVEDVSIAYGFNNLKPRIPLTLTTGYQQPLNSFTEKMRNELATAGFTELLTFTLLSRKENFDFLNKSDDNSAVTVAQPKTLEFEVVRTSLLPGVLKTIYSNRELRMPLKVFEISDVVVKDPENEVGARNRRMLLAAFVGQTSGFEFIHGLLDRIMKVLEIPWEKQQDRIGSTFYTLAASNIPSYFPGRQADVLISNPSRYSVGSMGIVHPDVMSKFEVNLPASVLQLDFESLFELVNRN